RGAAETQHRVLFLGLVESTADEVGVFVGLEVRQAHDDLLRPEGRSPGAHPFDQLVHIEADRIAVAGDALLDTVLHFGRQAVEVQQRLGMYTDHAVDDEFQPCQAHTFVRQVGEIECAVGVADVHHDLERQLGHRIHAVGADIEVQTAGIDHTGVAFGTGHRDFLSVLQLAGGVATTHHRGNAQFTGDDRRVAGTAAAVGDDGAGALHHRFPVGIGHVGNQHVAGLDLVHLGYVPDDLDRPCPDTLTDRAAFNQDGALVLQQVTLHDVDVAAALNGLRAGLHDVQLAVITVLGPLDVHRAAVVFLDDHGLFGQADHFVVTQAEARALGHVHIHSLDRAPGSSFLAVDHLDGLAAEVAA